MSGVYIHIPYCSQACRYCDFHFSTNLKTKLDLINCISKEIDLQKEFLHNKKLSTIYFGGGTPSILSKNELMSIFDSIKSTFEFNDKTEITLEANPDDLSIEQLNILKSIGINRLSIGIQSFDDRFLEYFNRSHTAQQAMDSVISSQNAGIDNISIDLIYGIPGQSLQSFKSDLRKTIDLGIPHVSAYCLTIEEKTVFGKWYKQGKLQSADEELVAKQFEFLIETLTEAGFKHYEISNFAIPGFESQHNSSYWNQQPYLGIGPGAHSYNGQLRQYNISNNPLYIKSIVKNEIPATFEILTRSQKINEYILTRIRTSTGIGISDLEESFNFHLLSEKNQEINSLMNKNLLCQNENHLVLTKKGRLFADKITEDLML